MTAGERKGSGSLWSCCRFGTSVELPTSDSSLGGRIDF